MSFQSGSSLGHWNHHVAWLWNQNLENQHSIIVVKYGNKLIALGGTLSIKVYLSIMDTQTKGILSPYQKTRFTPKMSSQKIKKSPSLSFHICHWEVFFGGYDLWIGVNFQEGMKWQKEIRLKKILKNFKKIWAFSTTKTIILVKSTSLRFAFKSRELNN